MTRRVIYSCPFIPGEWIAAHGFRPSRCLLPRPQGEVATAIDGTAAGVCPYMRAFIEYAAAVPDAEAVILTTLCDQMRRGAELLSRARPQRPVFLLNFPATWQTVAAGNLYISELKRLGRFLVRLGGTAPSREHLAEVMTSFDRSRAVIRDARGRTSPRAFAEAIAQFRCTGEIRIREDAPAKDAVPVALVGPPLMTDDLKIFDLVAEAGGSIDMDATDSGERTLPRPFDRRALKDDPLMELADACFGGITHPGRRPNSDFYNRIKHDFRERGIRGIIFRRYVWCDTWHVERQRMAEWAGLPLIDIDIEDCQPPDTRTANLIQAFIETLR